VKTSLDSSDTGTLAFKAEGNFWNGKESGYLLGTLDFPKTDNPQEKFPAMVIMHGSSGMGYRGESWGEFLTSHGVATFRVDYHSPRGLNKPGPKGPKTQHDIFSAIRVLSTHPRVDNARIGVMGFSRGGTMALMSTDYKSRDTNGIDPKAFIAIYPGCGAFSVSAYTTVSRRLVLGGDKDV
jgi:dienelactone hydrolase